MNRRSQGRQDSGRRSNEGNRGRYGSQGRNEGYGQQSGNTGWQGEYGGFGQHENLAGTEDTVASRADLVNMVISRADMDSMAVTGDNKVVSEEAVVMARVDTENRKIITRTMASAVAHKVVMAVLAVDMETSVATGAMKVATGAIRVDKAVGEDNRAAVDMETWAAMATRVHNTGAVRRAMATRTKMNNSANVNMVNGTKMIMMMMTTTA